MYHQIRCPKCSKRIRVEFPYNVDLHHTMIIACCECGQQIKLKFSVEGMPVQGIFKKGEYDG